MNAFWQSRSDVEKRSLFLLALFILLLALWYGVIQPLNNAILRQQQENERLKSEIQWVNEAAKRSGLVASQPLTADVPAWIKSSAAQADLHVEVKTVAPRRFIVALKTAGSSAFFSWLESMQNCGLQVSKLQLRAGSAPDIITIEILELYQVGPHD